MFALSPYTVRLISTIIPLSTTGVKTALNINTPTVANPEAKTFDCTSSAPTHEIGQ